MTTLKYAVLDENDIVEYIIDIDEVKKNSSFTSYDIVKKFFPDKKIVQECDQTGKAQSGLLYHDNVFTQPCPYNSWKWNGSEWIAPVQYPENNRVNFWDEEKMNWLPYTEEELNGK